MCGILGGNNNEWNYEKGIQSIYHRGPDAQRLEKFKDITLAFTRLSIIDLSDNGMQPMTSQDSNVTIVYNGEIYGYDKLKKQLAKKYLFTSNSDTEVILNAYLEYGDNFIDKIDGMFAFAIYDRRTRQLKLYRDRTGIKPLYYYYCDSTFVFASELKAIENASIDINWNIDYTALYDYLFYGYIPDPKTIYKNCYKLPPAYYLVYDLENRKIDKIEKYWKLHVNTSKGRYRKEEILRDELRSLLSCSVKKQLVADVPVGCFLSGGIDSSIISYESNKYSPDIHTYTIGFKEKKYDESEYAHMMIQKYSLNCSTKVLNYNDVNAIKDNLKIWYDEPFADTSAYPSYIISQLARKDVKVVLTGDGGDELFGGYDRYQLFADTYKNKYFDSKVLSKIGDIFRFDSFLSAKNRQRFINTGLENYFPYILLMEKQDAEKYRSRWKIDRDYDPYWYLKKYYIKELPIYTRVRYLDFKTYLPGDILTKVDRVSMVNSLEARVPFLGREVIEFAFSLSEEECCNTNMLKEILKTAYDGIIPKQILFRKKRGFSVPPNYLVANRKRISITCECLNKNWKELIK